MSSSSPRLTVERVATEPSGHSATWRSEAAGLLALSTPVVTGLVVGAAPGLVDSLVLGDLGAPALGAVSLTGSVTLVFIAALYGMLTPVGLAVARSFGRADPDDAQRQLAAGVQVALRAGALAMGLHALAWLFVRSTAAPAAVAAVAWAYWLPVSLGLLPFALLLAYKQAFEAIERPWLAMGCMALMVAVDAAVSATLAHGLLGTQPWGLLGAGLGNLVGQTVALAALWQLARRHRHLTRCLAPGSPPVTDARRRQWQEGAPMGLQYLAETGATAGAGLLIGHFGAIPLAGNQIATAVTMALYMAPLGLATAVGLRLAQAHGSGQPARHWPIAMAGLLMATAWMGSTGLALAVSGHAVAAWFTVDPAVAAASAALFLPLALMQVADGVQSVSVGALRALQSGAWSARVTSLCYWIVALPAAWAMSVPAGLGAPGVWLGFTLGVALSATLLTLRLKQLTRCAARDHAHGTTSK